MIEEKILDKEALERWGQGDPSGYLEISHKDVTYFDPFIDARIDGLDTLTKYYEGLKGKIQIDQFEIINPRFIISDNLVVLSYNYVSYSDNNKFLWNCTEVYQKIDEDWKIIQTHWSITKPKFQT